MAMFQAESLITVRYVLEADSFEEAVEKARRKGQISFLRWPYKVADEELLNVEPW